MSFSPAGLRWSHALQRARPSAGARQTRRPGHGRSNTHTSTVNARTPRGAATGVWIQFVFYPVHTGLISIQQQLGPHDPRAEVSFPARAARTAFHRQLDGKPARLCTTHRCSPMKRIIKAYDEWVCVFIVSILQLQNAVNKKKLVEKEKLGTSLDFLLHLDELNTK